MNPLTEFPFALNLDLAACDKVIRTFADATSVFFDAIASLLREFVILLNRLLVILPWWVFIALIVAMGWRLSGKWSKGILYGAMLFLVGLFGLWGLMCETLAIVLVSVILSLIFGFPVGILLARNAAIERAVKPILDTMQTMPVFVYLIPALLFFGMGKAPAVVATVVYSIVPMIRLTCHGIRQVDREVVEAANAFGSTYLQTLFKVQIPQAMPTIMTGVNQTMMMAMAMVVTCSMIGATGLGMEVLIGVNRNEMTRGIVSGSAVVIMAVIMDRLTQYVSTYQKKAVKGDLPEMVEEK